MLPANGVSLPGIYGALGTFAAGNTPGNHYAPAFWTDKNGHLWLFGGVVNNPGDSDGNLNDLWEFNPSTNEWAWMGGSSAINQPGVNSTLGTPATGNIPGSRSYASSWTDRNGSLWLFGGSGDDASGIQGSLNDIWEFNPSTNEWAWMGGSSTEGSNGGQSGIYGTLGTPAAANTPGGRYGAMNWTDNSGNFWLLGGYGFDANGIDGYLNDLWVFSPSTNEWTWMSGSTTAYQIGIYGTQGTPAAGNIPVPDGARGTGSITKAISGCWGEL
ncbi:MAG: kelch repeat-containing protein [Terracidiphilus sp.]